MQAAHPQARTVRTERSQDSERKCLVTGEVLPKADLIRFVAGPDHSVIPDLAQNLPGRGLWVKADRDAIQTAARKNLFSKAAKQPLKADPDLADEVAKLLRKRCLEFIGLARRAGIAVLGQPQVEAALKAGKISLLLLADDASQMSDVRSQMSKLSDIRPLTSDIRFTRNELGTALGHDQIVYAGLKAHALTEKLAAELARLEKIAARPISDEGSAG
jgi:predicted RNA-binding protein YlxR (DUF448 family)